MVIISGTSKGGGTIYGFQKDSLGPLDRLGLLRWHPCANRKSTIFDASRASATGKAQRGKRKEEFHGFGGVSRGSFAWHMNSRAQLDPVEFWFFFKISQHRSNQVSDMLIEGEGRQLVARSAGRRR